MNANSVLPLSESAASARLSIRKLDSKRVSVDASTLQQDSALLMKPRLTSVQVEKEILSDLETLALNFKAKNHPKNGHK